MSVYKFEYREVNGATVSLFGGNRVLRVATALVVYKALGVNAIFISSIPNRHLLALQVVNSWIYCCIVRDSHLRWLAVSGRSPESLIGLVTELRRQKSLKYLWAYAATLKILVKQFS